MARKKAGKVDSITTSGMATVRITGAGCSFNDRRIMPGETATVPKHLAEEWILTGRAVMTTAEVHNGER